MNTIKLMVYTVLVIFLTLPLYAQSTLVRGHRVSLKQDTNYIPNYVIAEFDLLGLFGRRNNPNSFRLVNRQTPLPICVPINTTDTYMVSIRGIWSKDANVDTGIRALSIRVLRNGVWYTLAQNFTNSPKNRRLQQTVLMMNVLNAGDCIGTLVSFKSQTSNLNFILVSLLITKVCT